ncbi:MAG: LysR substrate-binding domain-containing protein [Burkholderiales bacterium]|jgi:DNA-binding transcriptional LysR family regulator|nr:LysR substrate-binding domain-containing protein [Burkholderiales bacterium]
MHVTWRQLKVFETVARLGSFTRAAEELFLAQPTVSMQVKQLAEAVDQPLFEQTGRRIQLTEVGDALYATCREMFDTWARFEMTAADLKGLKRGRLRLACVTTAKYFVPRLLGPFCDRYPGIDVRLEVANRDAVVERLARNEDDLYIMGTPPQHFDIALHPFLENALVVIAPAGHPLAGEKRIPLARIAEEKLLLRERGSGTRMAAERHFRDHGFVLKPRMELATNEAIKHAVAGGLGISVLSQLALTLEPMQGQLAILDVEGFPLKRHWYVVHPGKRDLSVVAQTFFDYLRDEAGALLPPDTRAALLSPGEAHDARVR